MTTKLAIETYDKIAQKYEEVYGKHWDDCEFTERFFSMLKNKDKVLDVGCGTGNSVPLLLNQGCIPVRIDLSSKMLDIARKKFPKVKFSKMDMRKLHFKDNEFDAIFCGYALIHIEKNQVPGVLNEFSRVLKKGGLVFFALIKGDKESIVKEPLDKNLKMFFVEFEKDEIERLLKRAGFSVLSMDEDYYKDEYEEYNELFLIAKKNRK
ncbi:MAG: Arsenite methyltransferase [Candidatus Woesearchaeota archaeon]|nr:Arsenite methyltransferase [Candidatus Woesearchaeota archaeon]